MVRNCLWQQERSRFESVDELISAVDTAILAEQSLPRTAIWTYRRWRWSYVAIPVAALLVLIIGLVLVLSQFVNVDQGATAEAVDSSRSATTDSEDMTMVEGAGNGLVESSGTFEPAETVTHETPPIAAAETTVSVF